METTTSKDGTMLAFDRWGTGRPSCSCAADRSTTRPIAALAQQLASNFTVFNYDRRGRGDSGDTSPYAIEREVEDAGAVVDAAGGEANLWGSSSGAALALICAEQGLPITKLALWEPPYFPDGVRETAPDQVEQYETMVAEDRRGDAVEYFMSKVVGMPPEFVAGARSQPGGGARGDRPHARLRRPDHGRLHVPARTAAAVKVPTARVRRRRGYAVDARHGDRARGRAPRRGGRGSSTARDTTSTRPSGAGAEGVLLMRPP